ncbi:MAG TPA: hypothetical protein VLG71_01865, partial [Candidatus Limnocylindria bacterium]|nr:hypothetical protein [Candidatus Limnocylindria bacterium]
YNMQEIKEACKELARGKTIKKNLNRIRKQMWYLYEDGLVGHGSKLGSIRYNEKTGITETPIIESRGVYGAISDQLEPIRGMAEFAAKTGGFLFMLEKSKQVWMNGLDPLTKLANGLTYEAPCAAAADMDKTYSAHMPKPK